MQIGLTLTADELLEQQRLAARHVTFSLTEACPLRCAHCIVATVAPSDRSRTMTLAHARQYAGEMDALRSRGVRFVSFTGGEPLMASRQLRLLSDAAGRAGLIATVVTACHWATSDSVARRTIDAFSHISHWHLSTDLFHEPFVPTESVIRAATIAHAMGRAAMVRMATAMPVTVRQQALYDELRQRIPAAVPIVVQPVTRMGRGADIESEVATAAVPAFPCVPNGMVVRFDGTIAPCCAGLVDQRTGHPFQYGRADEQGVAASHERWCTDPLLQMIRSVGFGPLLQWIGERSPDHEALRDVPSHPCECCARLWRDPALQVELRDRAERPENRRTVAQLTSVLFGESFMGA